MNLVNILMWVVFGGIAGWVASLIVGTDGGQGILGNIIVGIIGAFLGGWIADIVGVKAGKPGADRPSTIWAFIWAVVGAVVLLFLLNLIF